METYTEGGEIVEHSGGGWGEQAGCTQADKGSVETDDKSVIILNAVHQSHCQPPQLNQLP